MNTDQIVYHPLVSATLSYAKDKGVKDDFFSGSLNLDRVEIPPSEWRLTSRQLELLGRELGDAAEDEHLGLHVGENLQWGNVGIVGYMVLSSRNVIEGLRKYHSYYQAVSNITEFEFLESAQTFELCWKTVDDDLKPHDKIILEGTLASLKGLLAKQTGRAISPVEIQFCWPAPADLSEYERVFDTRLIFNQPRVKAVFDRTIGEIPCQAPNTEMLTILESYLSDRYAKVGQERSFSKEVLTAIKAAKGKILTIDQVSDHLGIGVRALQMKLKSEGTLFRNLRDQALCEQARLFLEHSPYTNEEISERLGFSETGVFYRSFKRWTGETPRTYRHRLRLRL